MKIATNILLVAFVLFIVHYMLILLAEKRRRERLLSLHIKKNSAQRLGERIQSIRIFYQEIETALAQKNHAGMADVVFYGIVGFGVIISVAMMITGQFVLAILYPIVYIWFVRKIITITRKDPIVTMESQMPAMIDNLLRVSSKYSDIKTLIYETANLSEGPLQEELQWISRQMITKDPKTVLEEFSTKHNSVWLNNFAFTLIGYLGDSSKEETIRNLRHLRNILEKENQSKRSAISERKPSLMINYSLAIIGVVMGFANLIFNKMAFDFFFHSYLGLICFTGGFGTVMATIYMNIKMMQIKK